MLVYHSTKCYQALSKGHIHLQDSMFLLCAGVLVSGHLTTVTQFERISWIQSLYLSYCYSTFACQQPCLLTNPGLYLLPQQELLILITVTWVLAVILRTTAINPRHIDESYFQDPVPCIPAKQTTQLGQCIWCQRLCDEMMASCWTGNLNGRATWYTPMCFGLNRHSMSSGCLFSLWFIPFCLSQRLEAPILNIRGCHHGSWIVMGRRQLMWSAVEPSRNG